MSSGYHGIYIAPVLLPGKFELLKIPDPKFFKVFVHIPDVTFVVIQLGGT